jgi:thioredoxin
MKTAGKIIATIIVFFVAGGLIVAWSVYQKGGVEKAVGDVKVFTDENFQELVVEASKMHPILIDFYADWCFPCKLLEPIIEQLAKDFRGKAVIGRLNAETNMIARRFDVKRIPTVFIIRDGEIKDAFYGVVSKEKMAKALRDLGS